MTPNYSTGSKHLINVDQPKFQVPVGQRGIRGILKDDRRQDNRHERGDGDDIRHPHRKGADDPDAHHQQPVREEPRHVQPHGRARALR